MSLSYIQDFHTQVKTHPKQFCQKIHIACQMIDKLLKRKDIEYKESDVLAFEEMCKLFKHWKGTSKQIKLDTVQKWIVACVIGIKIQNKDGEWVRYFRECRIFVAKKWGKSVLQSLFAIWGLIFDKEQGAEIVCGATKKEQAKIVYDNICVYRKQSKDLLKITKEQYLDGQHYISCEMNNGTIKYLSASKKGLDGKNPHVAVFDEIQEITDFEVLNAVRTGQATRKQPLFIASSTAGTTPNSVYQHMYSQIEVMCEQKKFDDKLRVFFAVFEIDPLDKVEDRQCWIKANPAMLDGRPTLEALEKEYGLALIGENQNSLPTFISKHLNRACDNAMTFYETHIVKQCQLDICEKDYNNYNYIYAWGGVDLAETTDLCVATVLIVRQSKENDKVFDYTFIQRYFMPRNRLERNSQTDRMIYSSFLRTKSQDAACQQLLYLSEGDSVNFHDVTNFFIEMRDKYNVCFRKICYDPWRSSQWKYSMIDAGFSEEKRIHNTDGSLVLRDDGQMSECRQGKYLSDLIKELKVLFEQKRVRYDRTNLLFPYCCTNAKVQIDKDNLYQIVKQKSNGRIDGLLSALCAMRAWDCDKVMFLQDVARFEEERNKF